MKKAIVCGAGIGGLVSALEMSRSGYDVTIFEKNDYSGGKMSEVRTDGYRFDAGPSVITMPHVINDFIETFGKDTGQSIEFEKPELACRYFWEDATVLNWYSDHGLLQKEIRDVFGEADALGFSRCMEYGKKFYELTQEAFLESEFRIKSFMTTEGIRNASKFVSGRSMNDVANKFFRSAKMKQWFNRFATFTGSSPYLAPQFFSILPYTEFLYGHWHVKGGIFRIAEALTELCREFNVELLTSHTVIGASSDKGRITSLKVMDSKGKEFLAPCDIVISNFTSLEDFMPEAYFRNDDWSSSAFIMLLGMKRSFPALHSHNIFFSGNYEKEFIEIVEKKIPAKDMSVYVSVSSKFTPQDAPPECENWFVFVNAPYNQKKSIWNDSFKNEYADMVTEKLQRFVYLFEVNLKDYIEFKEIISPQDIRDLYGSEFGSIYGLSSNSIYTLMKRPKNRSSKYRNLFFAGGNTHPGGGVPMCFLSGKIAAGLAAKSLN